MALDLATAVVSITGDHAPLRNAIAGAKAATDQGVAAMQAKLRKLGDTFMRIGKRMTMFVTMPIIAGFGLAVKAASDFEESSTKFDAVFKELKGEARAWALDFAKSARRSKADVIEWMGSLQDTFVPLGIARKRALELSQGLVELGVDVASFQNKADADVIHTFTRALTGERESLKQLGIVILEADVQQEILARGWAKTTKEITTQMKAEATFNLIIARSTDAIGDNARTAGGLANQMRALKGDWKDVSIVLGEILIPFAKQVVSALSDMAMWVKKLTRADKELILGLAAAAAAAGPLLVVLGFILRLRMATHLAQVAVSMKLVAGSTTAATTAMNAYAAASTRAAAAGGAAGAAGAAGAGAGGAAAGAAIGGAGLLAKGGAGAAKAVPALIVAYLIGLVGQKFLDWRTESMQKERGQISQQGSAEYNLARRQRTGYGVGETGPVLAEGQIEVRLAKRDSDNLETVAKSTKKTAQDNGGLQ